MRIGLIARADFTGLGVQTFDFYRHMQPHKTLVVDLTHLNGQTNDWSRYPGAAVLKYTPYPDTSRSHPKAVEAIDQFLDDLDLVFTCETPYDYHLFSAARSRGVKTILQYNFELLDHVREPDLPRPDLFMAPSLWRYDEVRFHNKTFVPVPVDRSQFPFQRRNRAAVFVNSAGTGAMEDRNGTQACIDAWKQVGSQAKLHIYSQNQRYGHGDRRIKSDRRTVRDAAEFYYGGDVFVLPRKFGGLCLPLNEALSAGMPVIMTDLLPQNEFLPRSCLIPTRRSHQVMTKMMVDIHQPDLTALASKVDEMVQSPELVGELSDKSDYLASRISWEALGPIYRTVFECVMDGDLPMPMFSW